MMTGRVAVITGAAQGVGDATAKRLLRDGISKFALADMDADLLSVTASALRHEGASVVEIAGDLSNVGVCKKLVTAAIAEFGRIDVLANCAGSTTRGGLLDTDEAAFDRLFDVNVKAPFFLMQLAANEMIKKKSGVIVNISSMLAHGGPPFLLTYSATKSALVTITRSAANALKRDGIRVFAINLGWTVTPTEHRLQTQFHGMPDDWAKTIGDAQPFGRLLTPDDPAGVISFLVSHDASMMTGVVIDLEQHVHGTTEAAMGALKP